MKRKIICIVLCLITVIPLTVFCAFAKESAQHSSLQSDVDFLQYDYLDENAKAVYNEVKADPFKSEYIITLPNEYYFDSAYPELSVEDAYPVIYNIAAAALTALSSDYPMLFWFDNFSYLPYPQYPDYDTLGENSYRTYLRQIKIITNYNKTAYPDLKETTRQLESVVNNFTVYGFTRYEKVKSIHDEIIRMATYDPNVGTDTENATDRDPAGVLLEPHITVCEGYAEAFKLICDREKIPCVIVLGTLSSGRHAWNYVQMDDGKWYAVDLTLDDQQETTYINFLVGTNSTDWYSDSKFSNEHKVNGKRFMSADYTMTYPQISDESYMKIIPANNSTVSYDRVNNRIFMPSGVEFMYTFSDPYGWYDNAGFAGDDIKLVTGSSIVMQNMFAPDQIINYTLIIRGDVNCDGKADTDDFRLVKNASVEDEKFDNNSAPQAAADLNSDGVVDGFDSFLLDKILNGYQVY